MGLCKTISNSRASTRLKAACLAMLVIPVFAQADVSTAEKLGLPEPRHLAAALSDPESRIDTLLTLVAVQRLADYGRYARAHEISEYADRFRSERDWLEQLAGRYVTVPLRSSLFDPAAWSLLLELDQYDLSPGLAVSPFGPATNAMLAQLFDRSAEIPATTILPEVLSRMEAGSILLWNDVLEAAGGNLALAGVLQLLNEEWFDIWVAAEPPAPGTAEDDVPAIEHGLRLLGDVASAAQQPGPPDALDLKRLRYSLLVALPELGWQQSMDAAYLLALANVVDGLYQKQYLAFTESLLWIASGLLASELPNMEPAEPPVPAGPFPPPPEIVLERLPGEPEVIPPPEPYRSPVPDALAEILPALSASFEKGFQAVDTRLSTALAAVFDVVQYTRTGQGDPDQLNSLRMGIADSVAQFALLIPDMDYYFRQPVRGQIAEEINICISMAASRDEDGAPTLRQDGFERCLNSLANLAATRVNASGLAGDPDGPFGMEQLRRELMLTPWQRINYVLGYLLENSPAGCQAPDQALPNPLEWSSLVTVMTWFARQSPVMFQAPENAILVSGLRQQGRDMLDELIRQIDCLSGAGGGINDPVVRGLSNYGDALDDLVAGLRETELEFRQAKLKPGADILIRGDSTQSTAYRPENLAVGPCDQRYICEMAGELEATPELIDLFPEPYLVADQSGLGTIDICYDNVQWINRRSEAVREDDPHVANYYGQFSFDLFGTFTEEDDKELVFGFNLVSPDEYHYLFGAATEEVLNDSCPTEWVGSRIVTGLGQKTLVRVVPDRLTYLAAARSLPSQLMGANWDRNQLWRDWFIRGEGVKPIELEPTDSIRERVDQHLRGLHQAGQSAVYNALLNPPPRSWRGGQGSLYGRLRDLGTRKNLVRSYVNLFYPLFMVDSDEIRGSLEGSQALLDPGMLRQFRRDNVDVATIPTLATQRLEQMYETWNRQPETVRRTGSVATSLVHAIIRLDALYRDFFAPASQPPPPPVTPGEALMFDELDG